MYEDRDEITVGDSAPDFTMPSTRREAFTLSAEVRKQPILLYFYPLDHGKTCGEYMAEMIQFLPQINDLGVTIVHINPGDMESHMSWVADTGSPFEHICDIGQCVSKGYGAIVSNEKASKILGYTNRELFLVDEGMSIRYIWRADMPAETMPIPILLDELGEALGRDR